MVPVPSHALFMWQNKCVGHSMTNCLSYSSFPLLFVSLFGSFAPLSVQFSSLVFCPRTALTGRRGRVAQMYPKMREGKHTLMDGHPFVSVSIVHNIMSSPSLLRCNCIFGTLNRSQSTLSSVPHSAQITFLLHRHHHPNKQETNKQTNQGQRQHVDPI